ncbi:MAG: hypothetical protein ABWY05_13950 [Noviherbaspirillum sp.]
MSISYWPFVAALALLPVPVIAQQLQAADPADARAPVPPPAYVSAYARYRATTEEPATPDQAWNAANAAVGGQDAHAAHGGEPSKAAAPPAARPDPHAGHQQMQGK